MGCVIMMFGLLLFSASLEQTFSTLFCYIEKVVLPYGWYVLVGQASCLR